MERRKQHLAGIVMILAVSLSLSGCGGGDGDGSPANQPPSADARIDQQMVTQEATVTLGREPIIGPGRHHCQLPMDAASRAYGVALERGPGIDFLRCARAQCSY